MCCIHYVCMKYLLPCLNTSCTPIKPELSKRPYSKTDTHQNGLIYGQLNCITDLTLLKTRNDHTIMNPEELQSKDTIWSACHTVMMLVTVPVLVARWLWGPFKHSHLIRHHVLLLHFVFFFFGLLALSKQIRKIREINQTKTIKRKRDDVSSDCAFQG